jgi:hypothetical protein
MSRQKKDVGDEMIKLGCGLTLLLTVPIMLLVLLGGCG